MRRIHTYVFGVIAIVLLSMLGFSCLSNYLTFAPLKYPEGDWDISTLSRPVEDHWIEAADNTRLHAWYIPGKNTDTAVLWLHGNAGNITGRIGKAILWVETLPVSIFLLSYRGYGKSQGSPSEEGLYQDTKAAYNYLSELEGVSKIIIYGQSLGGAVAIELAAGTQPAGLIVEGAFTALADIGKVLYPFLPTKWIVGDQFRSLDKISRISCPKLFIHGDQDEVVPFEMGRKLFEAAGEPKTFYHVKGGDHNHLLDIGGEEYLRQLRGFLTGIIAVASNRMRLGCHSRHPLPS